MAHKVRFSESAWQDFDAIYDWVADRADPDIARKYLERLQESCEALRDYPRRGSPRDDVAPGLRTVAFEHRALIVYTVNPDRVLILRILHHGRDLGKAFEP